MATMDSAPDPGARWSRRQLLKVAGFAGIAAVAAYISDELLIGTPVRGVVPSVAIGTPPPAAASPEALLPNSVQMARPSVPADAAANGQIHYRSRPDLSAPLIQIGRSSGELSPGLILFTPNNGSSPDGPLIIDDEGNPIWIHPEGSGSAVNLRVATYRGEPVLTWWEGKISSGIGAGDYVIADTSYRELTRVHAGNGYQGDLHEFVITPNDTALFLVTNPVSVPPDLQASAATPGTGSVSTVIEAVVQEVDIASGRVLFEWHSLPAIDPSESYLPPPTDGTAYDYLHANSIDLDVDGNVVVSCRHTWAVYRIERASGQLLWRLNGKRSDFRMQPGAAFAWQHDARMHGPGTLSIFDDGADGPQPQFEAQSRGVVLQLDTETMTARLGQSFVHPDRIQSTSQGSFQLLPDGHAFIGWGSVPRMSEFDANGRLVFDASFTASKQSYRAVRGAWSAQPVDKPSISAVRSGPASAVVYASWNGATDISAWEVLAGCTPSELVSLGRVARNGMETAIQVTTGATCAAARALDDQGHELGMSPVVAIT